MNSTPAWCASPPHRRTVVRSFSNLSVSSTSKDLPAGAPRRLTRDTDDHFELFPSWSRDGRWIVFVTWDDQQLGTIRKVRATGGRSTPLSDKPGHYAEPRFSPDGRNVVYTLRRPGNLMSPDGAVDNGIYTVSANGGASQLVTREGSNPHYGDSNDRIFATRYEDGSRRLVSMNLRGESDSGARALGTRNRLFRIS